MSYRDIQSPIANIYGPEVSDSAITNITNRLRLELKEWQQRPLAAVYPFVWLDAVHYKIKDEGRYVNKAVYTVLGLNADGHKELRSLYLSDACVLHRIRNSLRYVASRDQKAFGADLKLVYRAAAREAAENALDDLETKWSVSISENHCLLASQMAAAFCIFPLP